MVSRSSAGGIRSAHGVGHEAQVLAWLAVYMLAERRLPEWAGGRVPTAVDGQTERPIDDVAATLSPSRILLIQAKNGMRLEAGPDTALTQVMATCQTGVPDEPPNHDQAADASGIRALTSALVIRGVALRQGGPEYEAAITVLAQPERAHETWTMLTARMQPQGRRPAVARPDLGRVSVAARGGWPWVEARVRQRGVVGMPSTTGPGAMVCVRCAWFPLLRRNVRVRSMPSISPCQPSSMALWRRPNRSSSSSSNRGQHLRVNREHGTADAGFSEPIFVGQRRFGDGSCLCRSVLAPLVRRDLAPAGASWGRARMAGGAPFGEFWPTPGWVKFDESVR